ncbi:MAG: PilZ domain-containing protein [Candidatus Omnitrophica bacterium]|nr:PilZ domain-containing protein [Candidatus Omnitrophota bacterium]
MSYGGQERRRQPRVAARFIVSYRILEDIDNVDTSQTKNLSLGGMLLTTNRPFDTGTFLALQIRLPFDPDSISITAKVLESRELIKDLIYDTRLQFLQIDDRHLKTLTQTVDHYLKRENT